MRAKPSSVIAMAGPGLVLEPDAKGRGRIGPVDRSRSLDSGLRIQDRGFRIQIDNRTIG
jgi:hypothetical protein